MMSNEDTDRALHGLLGEAAVRVPAWLYVQQAADGTVSFAGASRTPQAAHPLRYGSARTHQLIVGELVVRPHYAVATDVLTGTGLGGLVARGAHDLEHMLSEGEVLMDPHGLPRR